MTDLYRPARMIDTHQHLWKPSERRYHWLEGAGAPLEADFVENDVITDVHAAGITGTVLVQAEDSYEDTFFMLSVAAEYPEIAGVVAWAPLDRVDETEAALDLYSLSSAVRGIRVLNHDYEDPRWLLRDSVQGSIARLAPRGFALDVVSVLPEHTQVVIELADRYPELTLVIDHLAKPDIAGRGWQPWAGQLADAAARPNVTAKLSGLNTVSAPGWTSRDWQPYVDLAVATFGPERLMLGSDWPVSLLNGDFASVWTGLRESIAGLSPSEQDSILYGTAERVYRLETP
ncbi:MAG: amidohydrolase family protein [Lacisediminihabitans sp.]